MTDSNLLQIINEQILILKKLRFNIQESDIKKASFEANFAGLAGTIIEDAHYYWIKVNISQASTETKLLTAIYHELCHIIQFNEAFDAHLIFVDFEKDLILPTPGNTPMAQINVFENNAHTELWKSIVQDVLNKTQLNLTINAYATEQELSELFEEIFMPTKYSMSREHIDYTVALPNNNTDLSEEFEPTEQINQVDSANNYISHIKRNLDGEENDR